MKYRLRYSYSTQNYHCYIVVSRDFRKNNRKMYIPRDLTFDDPLVETDVIFNEPVLGADGKKRVKAKVRDDEIPF